MAKQFVNELKEDQAVDSKFSVKYKKPPREYKNGYKFTIGLSDRTREIELKYWGGTDKEAVQRVFDSFQVDDVIHVVGIVSSWYEKIEIHVNEGKGKIEKTEDFDMEDFVPKTKQDIDKMLAEIKNTIEGTENPHIKQLLNSFFSDPSFVDEFKTAPAGITMHHAYIGGLLEHTIHVLQICRTLLNIYPQLDKDLLFSGAILHDIGKIKEFRVTTNIKQSEEGMLRGHITMGEEMILERMKKVADFPKDLKIKIAHIMLAHHGNNEYGSPVVPAFAEAEAIYYADECDAKLDQHISIKEDPGTEDFRTYSRKLRRPVYLK